LEFFTENSEYSTNLRFRYGFGIFVGFYWTLNEVSLPTIL
jgi:hypothetical protein